MADKEPEPKQPPCFVIMPISDEPGYDKGHFGRVYEHLIKPACKVAGYQAVRADDTTKTNYIMIEILRRTLDSPLVLCDLSGRNPNVMYELGLRQAFNKPVVLIKDGRTEKVFDIQGLRFLEYDETLRVDAVRKDSEKLVTFLKETAEGGRQDVNSIVDLLAIRAATLPTSPELSQETGLILSHLESLASRMSALEDAQKPRSLRVRRPSPRGIVLPSGETVAGGETLYLNGEPYGEILGQDDDELILLRKGNLTLVKTDSDVGQKLSTLPF
ncbi:MAG: hypothetical protein DHS20C21_03420 [Gemmatimonadota bacterium]|nr:MAG: hypothetical protein DHS20C21_03420 [Gemmatimonadota bacterium]